MNAQAPARRDRLRAMLADLKMPGALEAVDGILSDADGGTISAAEAIEQLLNAQIVLRNNRRLQTAMRSSRLPAVKTLYQFDFAFQPSIKREQIESLRELGFLDRGENVILLGPPGVGKTHLAISLAIAAAEAGRRVYHGTLAALIESLTEAKAAGNLTRRLRVLTHPALLVVDEIGYLPINHGAVLFFQLINARREDVDCADVDGGRWRRCTLLPSIRLPREAGQPAPVYDSCRSARGHRRTPRLERCRRPLRGADRVSHGGQGRRQSDPAAARADASGSAGGRRDRSCRSTRTAPCFTGSSHLAPSTVLAAKPPTSAHQRPAREGVDCADVEQGFRGLGWRARRRGDGGGSHRPSWADHVMHHCHIVNIRGNSYRMKDHQNLLQSGSDRRRKRAAA